MQRRRYPMPDDVRVALENAGVSAAYHARSPYQRNDYIGWINRAVRPETRSKRTQQMLEELSSGDVYMAMPWKPRG